MIFGLLLSDVNSPCSEFDGGTPLHIAAAHLAEDAAAVLLSHGANPEGRDKLGRLPVGKSSFGPLCDYLGLILLIWINLNPSMDR